MGVAVCSRCDDVWLAINDLRFITAERAIAAGALIDLKDGRLKPAGLATADGGRTWSEIRMPDIGASLFFFDADFGWMAGASGIWRTTSLGREWNRMKRARDLTAIAFADGENGWAVSARGDVYHTSDGGRGWKKVEIPFDKKTLRLGPEKVKTVASYFSVAFSDRDFGAIAGTWNSTSCPETWAGAPGSSRLKSPMV